jgi:ABC-type lipoprotein release transport system permease subunit
MGAGKRQIRRVFRAEGVTLATLGWIIGLPIGWLLFRGLLVLIQHIFSVDITAVFFAAAPPVILIATIALTVLVVRPALRRAVRTQPGAALRYE